MEYCFSSDTLRASKATVRFETKPGQQLQHDWGELQVALAGVQQKVYIAVNTLGYSRRFHVMAAGRCDAEHTYESLVRSLQWFGGVPRQVWVDNQKSAVLSHVPGAVRFNERFKQCQCRSKFPQLMEYYFSSDNTQLQLGSHASSGGRCGGEVPTQGCAPQAS